MSSYIEEIGQEELDEHPILSAFDDTIHPEYLKEVFMNRGVSQCRSRQ